MTNDSCHGNRVKKAQWDGIVLFVWLIMENLANWMITLDLVTDCTKRTGKAEEERIQQLA